MKRQSVNPVLLARYLDDKEKTAASVDVAGTALATAATLGIGAGFGLLGKAISEGVKEVRTPYKKVRAYEAMLEANPELKTENAMLTQRHFSSVYKINKDFAEDPMIAGQFVRQAIQMQAVPMQQYNLVGKAQIPSKPGIFDNLPHVALQYQQPEQTTQYSPKISNEYDREARSQQDLPGSGGRRGQPPRSPRGAPPSPQPPTPEAQAALDALKPPSRAADSEAQERLDLLRKTPEYVKYREQGLGDTDALSAAFGVPTAGSGGE